MCPFFKFPTAQWDKLANCFYINHAPTQGYSRHTQNSQNKQYKQWNWMQLFQHARAHPFSILTADQNECWSTRISFVILTICQVECRLRSAQYPTPGCPRFSSPLLPSLLPSPWEEDNLIGENQKLYQISSCMHSEVLMIPGWMMKKGRGGGRGGHRRGHRCDRADCCSPQGLPTQQPLNMWTFVLVSLFWDFTSYNELKERGWPVARVTTWFPKWFQGIFQDIVLVLLMS